MEHSLIKNNSGIFFLQREGNVCNCPFAKPAPQVKIERRMVGGQMTDVVMQEEIMRQCGSWCPHFDISLQENRIAQVIISCGDTTAYAISNPEIVIDGK
jgi:hypothetical protein